MNVSEALPVAPVVNFITGNANKLREVKEILEPAVRVDNKELDIEEIQGSIEEIAIAKCRKAADLLNGPVLVEDTALCFGALNGLPGPYMANIPNKRGSKWFLRDLGNEGLSKLLAGFPDKSAEAVCTFAYSPGPGHNPRLFQGRTIVNTKLGHHSTATGTAGVWPGRYAEMTSAEKNKMSHRALALRQLQQWIVEHRR
ncbi:hypothetical protein jhhlp_008588 [Lomentospora prolificans]|uniref:XTP/dITP diphosphatase n=1 Tax=Lomentospora prolificans TaxID=41688 RepID=A0A2N3MYG0_9PEZI|nr:hypothetical protein jhhlp_008588 [Lomentospora prolificans]